MTGTLPIPTIGQPNSTEDQDIVDCLNTINGLLDSSNKIPAASLAADASPNNSAYKTLLTTEMLLNADASAATYMFTHATPSAATSGQDIGATTTPLYRIPSTIYFDNADVTVTGLTEKLRLRFQVSTNATAWSAVTATAGLYPVTFAGGADALTATLGTVVSGSTVAIANPGASATSQGNSGDFTVPSDGQFAIGVVTSAQLTNNAAALLSAQLQTRNV